MKPTRRSFLQTLATASIAAGVLKSSAFPKDSGSNAQDDICSMGATDMAALIRQKKLSAIDVMQAHLRRIERINSKVNAIVTQVPEDQLLAQARAADDAIAKGVVLGALHGLPFGVKDTSETKGIRTTYGSPLFKDFVPTFDSLVVERVRNAGAILVGKTNVPEFAMGSQTFNPVFGATLNPYDLTKTCGGSTGGGAVALACGMVPLANGTDMGGSLRNPGNFCNVVGIRPSPGRVPNYPSQLAWATYSVSGPMARNVTDCAFFASGARLRAATPATACAPRRSQALLRSISFNVASPLARMAA